MFNTEITIKTQKKSVFLMFYLLISLFTPACSDDSGNYNFSSDASFENCKRSNLKELFPAVADPNSLSEDEIDSLCSFGKRNGDKHSFCAINLVISRCKEVTSTSNIVTFKQCIDDMSATLLDTVLSEEAIKRRPQMCRPFDKADPQSLKLGRRSIPLPDLTAQGLELYVLTAFGNVLIEESPTALAPSIEVHLEASTKDELMNGFRSVQLIYERSHNRLLAASGPATCGKSKTIMNGIEENKIDGSCWKKVVLKLPAGQRSQIYQLKLTDFIFGSYSNPAIAGLIEMANDIENVDESNIEIVAHPESILDESVLMEQIIVE